MTSNMLDVVAAGRDWHVTRSYMLEVITEKSTWHNPSWHVMTLYMTRRWKYLVHFHSQWPFLKRKFPVMLQSTTLDLVTPLLPDKSIFLFLHFLRLHNWSVCLFNMLGYWPISLPWSDPSLRSLLLLNPLSLSLVCFPKCCYSSVARLALLPPGTKYH